MAIQPSKLDTTLRYVALLDRNRQTCQRSDSSSVCWLQVLTTAVMTDLPVISNILSRLFESSQYLADVSLHHLITALCSLSLEAVEMAYGTNKVTTIRACSQSNNV